MTPKACIVDTKVIVSGLIGADSNSSPARILDAMLDGKLPYLMSDELLNEYSSVLRRPSLVRLHRRTDDEIDRLLTDLVANAMWCEPVASGVPPGTHRSTYRYESVRPSQAALRQKISDLAQSRIRYGYKRIHILLKREDVHLNQKRVHRLYSEEGLQIRARRPRRPATAASRQPPRTRPWALTEVDVFTRECLAIEPGQSLGVPMGSTFSAGLPPNAAH